MTKTQRTILFFLPIQAVVVFLFYFLTRYWFFGVALQVGLTLIMFRRILTVGNRPVVLAKSTQPTLFLILASLYSMLLVQVYGVGIPYFAAQTVIISAIYGLICWLVLRNNVPVWLLSLITLLQLGLSVNFAALSMAYWRLPSLIVLLLSFVAVTYVALWWLMERDKQDARAPLYASIFGLLVAELVWVYSHWVLVYQPPRVNIVVAQVAVVTTALAYSLGGIHYHLGKKPRRSLVLLEYGLVFLAVFAITFISTRWISGF